MKLKLNETIILRGEQNTMLKNFRVSFCSKIAGGNDSVCVMAKSEQEALEMGKPMLDTHKLIPNFLNNYGRYSVIEITQ